MLVTETQEIDKGLLSSLLSDETFWPSEPRTIEETGLSESLIESTRFTPPRTLNEPTAWWFSCLT